MILSDRSSWPSDTGCDETDDYCNGVNFDRSGTVDLADLLGLVDPSASNNPANGG